MTRSRVGALALALSLAGALGCGGRSGVGARPDGGSAGSGGGLVGPGIPGVAGAGIPGLAGAGGGVSGVAGADAEASCGVPTTSQIPRLTNPQYDRTVRDLLGLTGLAAYNGLPAPSALLASDSAGPLTSLGWYSYLTVAQAIAAQVIADPTLRSRFLACTPDGDGTACLHDTIVTFGRRAFRRPLTASEVARFDKIVAARARITKTGAPLEVAEVLLQTFLASPSFIQRSEVATSSSDGQGRVALSAYEVASRLSYMLWGSAPDELLNQAADDGALLSREQIREQAVRMMADPRAAETLAAFHRYYIGADVISHWTSPPPKDATRFPAYTPAVAAAARAETDRFFQAVAFDQKGTFQDLLQSPQAFVTRETAPIYGLDGSRFGAELSPVTLPAAERPGFLTRVDFLSSFATSDSTSPIRRGAFVVQRIQGEALPPPNTPAQLPVVSPDGFLTNRARTEALTAAADCSACHKPYINPPGFVLEAYDGIGARQTKDPNSGAPIDTTAIVVIDGVRVPIRDPADLMWMLTRSVQVQRTYARRLVSYAYARESDPLDTCTVDALTSNITGGGYRIVDLLVDLTQTEAFKLRAREVTP